MKKLLLSIILAASTLAGYSQTNQVAPPTLYGGLNEIFDAAGQATNWTAIAGMGRGLTGSRYIAFADFAYNFTENVGVVLGYDYLWDKKDSLENSVKGGVTLQVPGHPFAFIGNTFLTNIVATGFVGDLLASPTGDANLGNIITTGLNFDVYKVANFEVDAGVQYENRSGQGKWDGNYMLLHVGISRRF